MMQSRSSRPDTTFSRFSSHRRITRSPGAICLLALAVVVLAFLAPYVFGGRSLIPLELITLFQPWAAHARELWGSLPQVQNPLLDSLQQYLPRRAYLAEALRGGWLPLWYPYQYGGTPFLATQQGTVLYPLAWVLSLLPPELQFGWSALFHLLLGGAGTFWFLRLLGVRPMAALTGAMAFPLNGYVVVWLAYPNVTQWTLCWLPLALYCWERGFRADNLRWMALAAIILALNILGGHGQSSEYVLMTWGLWALYRTCTTDLPRRKRAEGLLRWVVLPSVLLLALALGHLLPSLDYLPRTDRGARVPWSTVHGSSMPLSQLWTLLLPRLFGDGTLPYGQMSWLPSEGKEVLQFVERTFYPGASVLVLAWGALALPWRRRREQDPQERDFSDLRLFSLGLTGLAFALALGTVVYWPFWRFLPGFSQFTAVARVVCLAILPLACLAALGVQGLTDPAPEQRRRVAKALTLAAVLSGVVALTGHFLYADLVPDGVKQMTARLNLLPVETRAIRDLLLTLVWLCAPAALAGLTLLRRGGANGGCVGSPCFAGALTAAVVVADLFWFGFGFNPAAETRWLHATTPELQFLQRQTEPFRFLSAGPPGEEMNLKRRMPSNLPGLFGLADLSGSDSFVPLRYRAWEAATRAASGGESPWSRFGSANLRAAGVRYYLSGTSQVSQGLREAYPGSGPLVQEDPNALPYARVHPLVQALSTEAELLQALRTPQRFPAVAMVAGPDAPTYAGSPTTVPFTTRRINGNRLVIEGETPEPGLLVVCEQFEPGWRARVDGQETRLYPADHLLLGIPVKAGQHRVELTYAPDTYRVGAFGTLLGLATLGALCCGRRRTREG